jgi:hypothetical protein
MAAAKHTPGPWHIDPNSGWSSGIEGNGATGGSIVTTRATGLYTRTPDGEFIAQPPQRDEVIVSFVKTSTGSSMPLAERLANARLIAASPTLLTALRDLMDAVAIGDDAGITAALNAAEAAEAKATGSAS